MARFLLLSAFVAGVASQTLDDISPACVMSLSARRDAYVGNPTWDVSECEQRGFCWAKAPGNYPWCFHRDEAIAEAGGYASVDECAAGAASERRECAISDEPVNARLCVVKGCCWAPGEPGAPWCFWPAGVYAEGADDGGAGSGNDGEGDNGEGNNGEGDNGEGDNGEGGEL